MSGFTAVRVTAAGIVPAILLLAGCGSSSSATAGRPAVPAASVCTQIADVLGDGPDPDSDPVGYAEAQVGPLAAVHAGNAKLQAALARLDAAYRQEFAHGATVTAKTAVKAGRRSINGFCPGAAS
jgi:hypothetical protein